MDANSIEQLAFWLVVILLGLVVWLTLKARTKRKSIEALAFNEQQKVLRAKAGQVRLHSVIDFNEIELYENGYASVNGVIGELIGASGQFASTLRDGSGTRVSIKVLPTDFPALNTQGSHSLTSLAIATSEKTYEYTWFFVTDPKRYEEIELVVSFTNSILKAIR